MKPILRAVGLFLAAFLTLLLVQTIFNRRTGYKPKDAELFHTIQHMDSVMFEAFNHQKLGVLKTLFSDSLESYQDSGGRGDYNSCVTNFDRLFAENSSHPVKRQLIPNSLEVYAVPGFGAVEMGLQRFIHRENGTDVAGLYKFVHTWRWKDGQWKLIRIVSVRH